MASKENNVSKAMNSRESIKATAKKEKKIGKHCDEYTAFVKHTSLLQDRSKFDDFQLKKFRCRQIRNHINNFKYQNRKLLEQRKYSLADLLNREEDAYSKEMSQSIHNSIYTTDTKLLTVHDLFVQKEIERQKKAEELLHLRNTLTNSELRDMIVKQRTLDIAADRLRIADQKNDFKAKEKIENALLEQKMLKENEKYTEAEKVAEVKKYLKNKNNQKDLLDQIKEAKEKEIVEKNTKLDYEVKLLAAVADEVKQMNVKEFMKKQDAAKIAKNIKQLFYETHMVNSDSKRKPEKAFDQEFSSNMKALIEEDEANVVCYKENNANFCNRYKEYCDTVRENKVAKERLIDDHFNTCSIERLKLANKKAYEKACAWTQAEKDNQSYIQNQIQAKEDARAAEKASMREKSSDFCLINDSDAFTIRAGRIRHQKDILSQIEFNQKLKAEESAECIREKANMQEEEAQYLRRIEHERLTRIDRHVHPIRRAMFGQNTYK